MQRIKNKLGIKKRKQINWDELVEFNSYGELRPLIEYIIFISQRRKYKNGKRMKTKLLAEDLNLKFPQYKNKFTSDNIRKTIKRRNKSLEDTITANAS